MARVVFTTNLRRHVDCPMMTVEGSTVGEVLTHAFAAQERLRAYVLDEQGALRKHMTILIDGRRLRDREKLSDAVAATSEVYVLQALSGG